MEATFKAFIYLYQQMVELGFNPIVIIAIIVITHMIKIGIPFIYNENKFKSLWTLLTSVILGVGLSFLYCFFAGIADPATIMLNCLINIISSGFSTDIMKALSQVWDHFFNKEKE